MPRCWSAGRDVTRRQCWPRAGAVTSRWPDGGESPLLPQPGSRASSPPHDAARRASGAIGSVFTKCPEQALKASNICIFPHAGRTACIALGHISALEIRWHCPACKSCAVIIARTHPSQRSCSCITLLLSCRWGGVPSFGLAMPQKPYAGVHAQYPKIRDDFGPWKIPRYESAPKVR